MNISGYRIVRTLGRGGMATVYLAEQQSVQREVALKVMSTTFLGDPQFGERFLREARIAARLRHPNVVQIHDVGVSGEHHYISMEHLPGGSVMGRPGTPRPAGFALAVASQIAGALDYAGSHGIVHRDIKPDNILLREDGTAVLTDFGIARATDAARMTRTGAVIGTPHYMSPEQARGQPLDGRADIYSLGVVLYELLVGQLPYQAEDALAVGIMHITAPLPQLPERYSNLQPLLDRMLAKEPAQRYQRGSEVAAAIAQARRGRGMSRETQVLPIMAEPGGASVMPDRLLAAIGKSEPHLGRLDGLPESPGRPRKDIGSSRRRRRWVWAMTGGVLMLLGAGGGVYLKQDHLRELLPQTRMNTLLHDAELALQQGLLSGSDTSARELYLAARALDPDNLAAQRGLQEVGRQLLAQAEAALGDGDEMPARRLLGQAGNLLLPAVRVDELERALRERDARDVELGRVLDAARAAAAEGRLDEGDDSAVFLYRRALALEEGNAVALAGLRTVLSSLLEQAGRAAASADFAGASDLIERVAALDPAHLGLPEARAALARARQGHADDIKQKLEAADELLARGQLLPPREPNALQAYRSVLALEPSQPRAAEGVRKVAAALLGQARRMIDDYRFDEAQALISQARALSPQLPLLGQVEHQFAEMRERREQVEASWAQSGVDLPSTLKRAHDAAQAGRYLVPPGESAYDLYRAVLAQAPDNVEARAGLAAMPDRILQRFEMAIGANRLATARDALDALGVVAPVDTRLNPARQRLARSYLAYASERLGAGEIERADAAITQARELDPVSLELPALQARLEQARGG